VGGRCLLVVHGEWVPTGGPLMCTCRRAPAPATRGHDEGGGPPGPPPSSDRRAQSSVRERAGYTPFSSWTSRPVTGGLKTHAQWISSSTVTVCLSASSSMYITPGSRGYVSP